MNKDANNNGNEDNNSNYVDDDYDSTGRVIIVTGKIRITFTFMKNYHKEIKHTLMYTRIQNPTNFVPLSSTISTYLQNGGELL